MRLVHILPSWVNWRVGANLTASGLKPCDGFYLKGSLHDDENDPAETRRAAETLRSLGFLVIPGCNVFCGRNSLADWTSPTTWRHVAAWIDGMAEPGSDWCLDFEAYWSSGQKYPSVEWVRTLAGVITPVIDIARDLDLRLHLLPGIHYGFALALAAALPGKIVDCDEATYAYGDPERRDKVAAERGFATWSDDLLARKAGVEAMGIEYRPGFHFPGLIDPVVQERMTQKDLKALNTWYYLGAADYPAFGKEITE